jgi:integrase
MSYAERTKRPPRTLTDREVKQLLATVGESKAGFRDRVIISMALGMGLRQSEIVALNIGDVTRDRVKPMRSIQLRTFKSSKRKDARPREHIVHVPDATWYLLEKYLRTPNPYTDCKPNEMVPEWPLFSSRKGNRLSLRQVRGMFKVWQKKAGIDHDFRFHELRHTAITNVRKKRNIRFAQMFARHASMATTVRYDHVSDEEMAAAVKDLVA